MTEKILALDIGGSKLLAAVAQTEGSRCEFGPIAHRKLSAEVDAALLLSVIGDVVAELDTDDFQRIGVTIPGLADPEAGLWVYAPFSGLRDFPIVRELAKRFGDRPIAIDNDVNACAWAEKQFGAARNLDDFLWITVSNGIGGGLVLNGRLYRGAFGSAAEIGHFGVVDQNGFPCGCGNIGCLEAEAAGPGMARRYAARLHATHKDTTLSAREICERAREGDELARHVVETTGALLGKAVGYAVNLLNLQAVFFGGGVMESFDLFAPSLTRAFHRQLFRQANETVRLERSALGYHAALAGATALARRSG